VELPVLPWFPVVAEPLAVWPPIDPLAEPCAFVSVPVWVFDAPAVDVVAVPWVFAWVPAVEPVPWIVPDVPSFDDVFVLLLPLLQPNTNAAASASP
jgi:hypothetical protein